MTTLQLADAAPAFQPRQPRRLAQLERLVRLLDSEFRLPGTRWRFGVDGLLGLIPGIGDAATATLGASVIAYAAACGVRRRVLARMAGNLAIDVVLGSVPLVGDVFDFFWKSNSRNLALLRRELDRG